MMTLATAWIYVVIIKKSVKIKMSFLPLIMAMVLDVVILFGVLFRSRV